jgi:hypothetical protein
MRKHDVGFWRVVKYLTVEARDNETIVTIVT